MVDVNEIKRNRNPFVSVGKVIKYEFLHSSKKLLPLYLILIVLGLLTGLSVNTKLIEELFTLRNGSYVYNTTNDIEIIKQVLPGILIFALSIFNTVVIVITIVTIARRFKSSMLGEEAYLNLSLPVTIGEQLWGRFIMSFLWIICCVIVLTLSSALCFIKFNLREFLSLPEVQEGLNEVKEMLAKQNLSFGRITAMMMTYFGVCSLYIISLIYAVNAIAHLIKKDKGVVKVILVVLFIVLNAKVFSFISMPEINNAVENWGYYFTRNINITIWIQSAFTAVYFAATYIVFKIKLNLE